MSNFLSRIKKPEPVISIAIDYINSQQRNAMDHNHSFHQYTNLSTILILQKAEQCTNNSSEPVVIIENLSQEFRSQINKVEIFNNVKSETNKKFDNYIFKTENDMDTNSDDTANDVPANSWLKNKHLKQIKNKECLQWCKKGCEKKDIYMPIMNSLNAFEDYNEAFHYNEAFDYFNLVASDRVLKTKQAGKQDIISDCYYDAIGIETNLIEVLTYYKICWKK
ncbi:5299_t:CDS:2 [Gigaspora margarita]|uniref:5299_t:CDS:1 n=1 Tax=Gigaspora margarita TaxID=4874 RepID=A0ABM8VW79_GIGMA|nr:5299_t:CDS:2 [Gigaspora margarita]